MISKDQLETWSKTGADKGSKNTYDRVKNIIAGSDFSKKNDVDIFIQGSYANTTHVRADSDVDIVIKLRTIWDRDISRLSLVEQGAYSLSVSKSEYGHDHLRKELVRIFVGALGSQNVELPKKCIKLNLGDTYLIADIIPCLTYKIYNSFSTSRDDDYIEGISIKTTEGKFIHNFPKEHINNGTQKHQETDCYYKRSIRVFKNMRNKLITDGKLTKNIAPSYFTECLLFNIPNSNFTTDLQTSIFNSVNWLLDNNDKLQNLKCQNKISNLFGEEDIHWNINNCQSFILKTSKFFIGENNA